MPVVAKDSLFLPNGLDYADGLAGRAGTPFKNGQLLVSQAGGAVDINSIATEEEPGYPTIERGEQCTIVHKFQMSLPNAYTKLHTLGRGCYLVDTALNISRVVSCRVERGKANLCYMTVTAESTSFDTPPDKFSVQPVEMGINILKHPRYYYAFLADGDGNTNNLLNQQVVRLLQDYFENTTQVYRDNVYSILRNSLANDGDLTNRFPEGYAKKNARTDTTIKVTGTDLAKRAGMEIIMKYWRGEETPYLVGFKMVWSRFYWKAQYINPGGVVEDPFFGADVSPQVPSYFYSPEWPDNDSKTLFDRLAVYNKQCYSQSGHKADDVSVSCLRQADNMDEDRTWFRMDRSWLVTPFGFWDPQMYKKGDRPQVPTDYLLLNNV